MCNGFKDDNLLTVTAEIGTDVAEKASWDKLEGKNLVWFEKTERKPAKINNDSLYLMFSLLQKL